MKSWPQAWPAAALSYLARRQEAGASEDCPLPELFSALVRQHPEIAAPGTVPPGVPGPRLPGVGPLPGP